MKIAVFAYSRRGCRTARKAMLCFPGAEFKAYTMERFAAEGFSTLRCPAKPFYGGLFQWADLMLFIGSCGIAVREIAPHVRDKRTDPAIVCIDELGRFVISLLSGHIGGANEMTLRIAKQLEATPVITTATDINNRFAVDAWAAKQGFVIDNIRYAKAISAAILERNIPLICDFPITTDYPSGVVPGNNGDLGICISWQKRSPFERTLRLVPTILHLGIGCRKGTTEAKIHEAVEAVLMQNDVDVRAIKCVASVDLKANEAGLLEYCKNRSLPVIFYSAEELRGVPGELASSAFVQSIVGVDNVCERAALVGAEKLIVKKTALNGVTVAIAAETLEVCFE